MKIGEVTMLHLLHKSKCATVVMILLAVIASVMVGGCMFNSKFRKTANSQCREWAKRVVEEGVYSKYPDKAARELATVQGRLDYYMCINRYFHHVLVSEGVFDSDLASIVGLVCDKLHDTDDDIEIWYYLMILSYVKQRASSDVVEDESVRRAVLSARARTKGKPYFTLIDTYARSICNGQVFD